MLKDSGSFVKLNVDCMYWFSAYAFDVYLAKFRIHENINTYEMHTTDYRLLFTFFRNLCFGYDFPLCTKTYPNIHSASFFSLNRTLNKYIDLV